METGAVEKQSNQLTFLMATWVNEKTFSDFLLHKEIYPRRAKWYSHSLWVSESDKPRSNPSLAWTRRQPSQSGALPLFMERTRLYVFQACGHKVCIAATHLCHESAKAATVNDWAQLYSHKTLFTRIVGREEFGHGLWFVNSYFNLSLKVTGTFQVTFTSM